jgi:NTE family protein
MKKTAASDGGRLGVLFVMRVVMAPPDASVKEKAPKSKHLLEFESIALLLQGGGALGAYQAGVYEALSEAGVAPDWVGGISIGAINGAIIAGNKPENRVAKLKGFWETITANPLWNQFGAFSPMAKHGGEPMRAFWNQMNATTSLLWGVPGFFTPHLAPPWFFPPGSPAATSFYDTSGFKKTLEKFIDFDVLNHDGIRYTTSAVNVRTGNYTVFDTRNHKIGPEHVMASGALPPALPAVEIEGQFYWDGGLISNTPLQWVMDEAEKDTLIFQVDLWNARGSYPKDMIGVMTRQKEIQYSSRTRAVTDRFKHEQQLRHAFANLYDKLPDELKKTEEAKLLFACSDFNVYNIVHLIYRAHKYEGYSKDFEFSRLTMEEHWKAGYNDTAHSLRHKEVLQRPTCAEGIMTYDVEND